MFAREDDTRRIKLAAGLPRREDALQDHGKLVEGVHQGDDVGEQVDFQGVQEDSFSGEGAEFLSGHGEERLNVALPDEIDGDGAEGELLGGFNFKDLAEGAGAEGSQTSIWRRNPCARKRLCRRNGYW